MHSRIDRALLLLNQSRFDLAEQEFRQSLAADPSDPVAHACLALCLAERQAYDEALREAREANQLGPDLPLVHYVRAKIHFQRDQHAEAEAAIREAIRLDPFEADFFNLLAAIQFDRGRWRDALESAEQGLTIDAEHAGCANLRAMALVKLGRKEEAGQAIDGLLARDPENALSHANQGWNYLEKSQPNEALQHFREALRIDPELDYARVGLVEGLKARYLVYRLMLRYYLWMSKLGTKTQLAVIIVIVFGQNILASIRRASPALAPLAYFALALVLVFVYLTWTSQPLFNLLLRLNKFGRYALSRGERIASNWVGACVLGVILTALALGASASPLPPGTQWTPYALGGLAYFAALILPISATASKEGWRAWVMGGYTAAFAGLGLLIAIAPWLVEAVDRTPEVIANFGMGLTGISIGAAVISTWLGLLLTRWR